MSTPARLIPIPSPTVAPSAARDFDFLMGPWRIRNTRLVRRLAGCNDWEVFDATGTAHPLPGGIGNFDTFTPLAWNPGYVGMALRVFNPVTQRWSIYWLDNLTGGLDPATGLHGTQAGLSRWLLEELLRIAQTLHDTTQADPQTDPMVHAPRPLPELRVRPRI